MSEGLEAACIAAAARNHLADVAMGMQDGPGSIIIHGASPGLAQALKQRASARGTTLVLTSTTESKAPFTFIHPAAAERTLQSFIPADAGLFIDLSSETAVNSMGVRLARLLPSQCEQLDSASLYGKRAFARSGGQHSDISGYLADLSKGSSGDLTNEISLETISVLDLQNAATRATSEQIVDWTQAASLPVKTRAAVDEVQFRKDKTYFIVGATGDLGLSLCRWMVSHGARYVALTSRNPNVDEKWLSKVRSDGAVVNVYKL